MTNNVNLGNFGGALWGLDPYGSEFSPFGVAGVTSISPHFVRVQFTDIIDLTDPAYTTAGNYVITPTLAVHVAFIESAATVILQTDRQNLETYTVTVGEAKSYFLVPMVPPLNTGTFTGYPAFPGYFSCATTPTRIRCIFSNQMLLNAALTDPSSYTVTDLNENVLPVISAVPEQSGNPLSVVLTLGVPMVTTSWYQTILAPGIVDINGQSPQPSAYDFQFVQPVQTTQVPISEFSGEVQAPPFQDHNGLVFFSPSLNTAASNSVIQVEEVDVCTTAYDTYTPPQAIDPSPFYLWSPTAPQTLLWQPGVALFADFPRSSEAKFEVGFTPTHLDDVMPATFDGSCSVVLGQNWAPGFVALLNDLAWTLFDGTSTIPPMFICADNVSPIPPGSGEMILVLSQGLGGDSTMTVAEPRLVHWATVHMDADSSFSTTPELAPTNLKANSIMRVARPGVNLGVTAAMVGSGALHVAGRAAPHAHQASATIAGYAQVHAHVKEDWRATAAMEGDVSIFAVANLHRPASASATGGSAVTASARVGPVATAALEGGSSMTAVAHVHRPASAAISGDSAVAAFAT
jgi:hypothetical protein